MSAYEALDSSMKDGRDGRDGKNGSRERRSFQGLVQNANNKHDDTSRCTTDAESISLKSFSSRRHHAPELSEPLTSSTDPFYLFRDDLERKLERMDESLSEYLRVVHHMVRVAFARSCWRWMFTVLTDTLLLLFDDRTLL